MSDIHGSSRSLETGSLAPDDGDSARLPELKDVAEIPRAKFADMLASEEGKKDLVIQGELMSLLEHVTPITFLRKYVRIHNMIKCTHKL